MKSQQDVRIDPAHRLEHLHAPIGPPASFHDQAAPPLNSAIAKTRRWLLDQQHEEGYWCGELEGDTILESETILLLAWLGQEQSELARKAAKYILQQQLPSGGWSLYPGGQIDISGSVKAYFALKLTGHDPQSPSMQRAREAVLAHGGANSVNSFTRFYLALLGQISYDHCPAVPPEMILMPTWLPMNLYRISAWSRTIVVPLSIMWAHRPVRQLQPQAGIGELFHKHSDDWPELHLPGKQPERKLLSWDRFFRGVDQGLKWLERRGLTPLRRRALQAAEDWVIQRMAGSDGLGAIFPPIIWSVVALKCQGYSDDSAPVRSCLDELEKLVIEENGTVRLQPCKSPVWDTAITLRALADSGVQCEEPAIEKGVDWLLKKEVIRHGDWARTVRAEPGGWFFEHHNDFYPDMDDTAMVLMALRDQFAEGGPLDPSGSADLPLVARQAARGQDEAYRKTARLDRVASASGRAIRWVLAMQNRDGGWGAFDRDNDCEFLCHVPFADHNAMIDPSTPDLTGRLLEALGYWGRRVGDPSIDRAVAFLRHTQEDDGSWYGRWGVNYIYGTWQVLAGLAEVGVPGDDPVIQAGVCWLAEHQQPSGGWGESAASYEDPALRGQGPATASQTAWALLGLLAAGCGGHRAVERGARYLLDNQQDDGTWDEPQFTGTGFPRVFYLRYHYYRIYFPLLALSRIAKQTPRGRSG